MKKVLIFILILSGFTSLAQDQFKPVKGNFTTELQLSLFNLNAKIDYYDETIDYSSGPFSMPGFRFRYFFNEKLALRTTLGLNFDHDKYSHDYDDVDEYYHSKVETSGNYTAKNRYTTFSISPGIEYHFGNFERMSLYVGGEIYFEVTTSKSTVDDNKTQMYYEREFYNGDYVFTEMIQTQKTMEMKNCSYGRFYYDDYYYYDELYQNAPMFFGVNALLGMDFYIYKGLYMGAELGFGYTYKSYLKGSYKETSTTTVDGEITVEDSENKKLEDKRSGGNLSFRYNPMIRFGWKFK
jgi:hypothetical protein